MDKNNTKLVIRPEKDSIANIRLNRCIIAGYPGVGKSTAASKNPNLFMDIESSDFHWIYENGIKKCNPEWPINYVNAIIEAGNGTRSPLYICISTHAEVLKELEIRHIYYIAVVPKTKEIYIQRYKNRGNSQEFIDLLDKKFEVFIKDIENSSAFGIYYTDAYITDIYDPYHNV